MTAVDPLSAAVAELGALPMPVGVKPFQTVPPRPADADVPLSRLEADVKALVARQRCQVLAEAAKNTNSPSDQIAYALDEWLITHPDAPVSTDADYPDFHPGGGA